MLGFIGDVVGGLIGKGVADDNRAQTDYWNKESLRWTKRQWNEAQDEFIQRRVSDAKKAGVHPLYALGVSSPGTGQFIPGQSESGNWLGEGIANAGHSLERSITGRSARRASARHNRAVLHNETRIAESVVRANKAKAQRDIAEAALAAAQARQIVTDANIQQDVVAAPRTFPLKTGTPIAKRKLISEPRRSLPAKIELVGPKGRRQITNPDAGLDEVGQVEYVVEPVWNWVDQESKRWLGGSWSRPDPLWENPKSVWYYWKNRFKRR